MSRQLPVYSPLPASSLAGVLGGGHARGPGELTRRLAAMLEVAPEAIHLTGSGTQALHLALDAAMRVTGRDRVALPAYTCWDVGSAAQGAGARAVYYDLAPADLTPDTDTVEEALRTEVAALVVSPLFGYPVDWRRLHELCERHGCLLVEDAAQAHGSWWRGGPAGSAGDLAVLSFGRGKGWTGAGGGALILRIPQLAQHVATAPPPPRGTRLPWAAKAAAQSLLSRPLLYGIPASLPGLRLGESVYHPPRPPRAMDRGTATLVLATEAAAETEAAHRRARARTMMDLMDRMPWGGALRPVRPAIGLAGEAGFLRLPLLIRDSSPSWRGRARRLGVERSYPRALPDVPELGSLTTASAGAPGARLLAEELFTLPTHSRVRESHVARILGLLAEL